MKEYISNENEKRGITIDYESEIRDLKQKHEAEVHYLAERLDETLKEIEVLKLKWSVVEMIFGKGGNQ